MESHDKLKETDIKNRTCFYLDHIIKIDDFDLDILIMLDIQHYLEVKNMITFTTGLGILQV